MKEQIENYTVYMHTLPNEKVYIGITGQKAECRWQNGKGYRYNSYFSRAIEKYGWENITHSILHDHLTMKEAEQKEREYIKKFKSNDKNYGYNLTDGGETGKHHSAETKRIISEKKKGTPSARKGVHLTTETKAKLSQSHKGIKKTDEQMQKCWDGRRKTILQYDLDNNIVAKYSSSVLAAKAVNGNSSNIIACARGKRNTAFNYKWKYEMERDDE